MIRFSASALRRRAKELKAAAAREKAHNLDAAALLMFYAAECGLKAVHMSRNGLKDTDEERGGARAASRYGHRIHDLAGDLRVPVALAKPPAQIALMPGGQVVAVERYHEVWRYGGRIDTTVLLFEWLLKLTDWAEVGR